MKLYIPALSYAVVLLATVASTPAFAQVEDTHGANAILSHPDTPNGNTPTVTNLYSSPASSGLALSQNLTTGYQNGGTQVLTSVFPTSAAAPYAAAFSSAGSWAPAELAAFTSLTAPATGLKYLGDNPQFVMGDGGVLYYVTSAGGSNLTGAIASADPVTGQSTALYSFGSGLTDPKTPVSLVRGSDGLFYGETSAGGANLAGTLFKWNPAGNVFTKLYDFCSQSACADGQFPQGMVQASDGDFYGTTQLGGGLLKGVLFRFDPTTKALTPLSSLSFGAAGTSPLSAPVQAADGNLYGVLQNVVTDQMIIWEYNMSSHTFATKYTSNIGSTAKASLYPASDGKLYGTSSTGGNSLKGYVFSYTPGASTITDVYDFPLTGLIGNTPVSNLVQGVDGTFYGLTSAGALSTLGDLYSMKFPSISTGPLTVSALNDTILSGTTSTITFQALNAFSLTMQQCYLYELDPLTSKVLSTVGPLLGTTSTNGYGGSVTLPPLVDGSYTITVQCGGGAAAGGLLLSVIAADDATSTSVVAKPGAIGHAGSTTLTATVADKVNPSFTPQGTVQFKVGSTLLGTCTLSDGSCASTVNATGLAQYSNNVVAYYVPKNSDWDSSSGSTTVYVADISFSSVSHNFGTWAVGTMTTGTSDYGVLVSNNTNSTVTFTITMVGSNEFSQTNSCHGSLAAGKTCTIVFAFAPTVVGSAQATWSFTGVSPSGLVYGPSNGGILTATAVAAPGVFISTNGHNFYNIEQGAVSGVFGSVVTNATTSAVSLSVGATALPFKQSLNNCPASLAPGLSCNLQWTFNPTALGTATETVPISSNKPILFGSTPVTGMKLTGTGVPFLGLTITTNGHNFGGVFLGLESSVFGVVISNPTGSAINLGIGNTKAPFLLTLNTCPAILPAGAACNLQWVYLPLLTGFQEEYITLTASQPIYFGSTNVTSMYLAGTGLQP